MLRPALRQLGALLSITRYRTAVWVFLVMFALFTAPYWALGHVMAPSCRSTVLGVTVPGAQIDPCGLQKFADYETEFLPEIANQLRTPHSGVVALRSPATEYDRPAKHVTGNTPANIYTWLIYRLSADPVTIITLLTYSLAACAGLFVLLLAREWQLVPLAGLGGAVLTSMGPFVSYWQTYPMHVATVCWSTAVLWGVVRWFRRADVVAGFTLLFATYALLLMGYPQSVVYVAWIIGVVVVGQLVRRLRVGEVRRAATDMGVLLLIVLAAVALAAPVLWDVLREYRGSARVAAPDEYYLQYILRIKAPWVLVLYAALHTVPELYGTVTDVTYPFRFDGFGLTLLPLWLVCVAIWRNWRHVWGWAAALAVLVLISVSPPLFVWLLHLVPGFGLSQWTPHWNSTLPLTVLVVYGIHAVVTRPAHYGMRAEWLLLVVPVLAIGAGVIVAGWYAVALAPARLGMLAGIIAVMGLWLWRRQPWWLAVALVGTVLTTAGAWQPQRAPATVVQRSALTDALQQWVPADARYALVDPAVDYLLAPNINRLYDRASVHTYNNFTPAAYQQAIAGLGGKTAFYGKLNTAIAPNYDTPLFWMSNIGAVLSQTPIDHPLLQPVAQAGPVTIMQVRARMSHIWQTPLARIPYGQDIRFATVRDRVSIPVRSYVDADDHITVGLNTQSTPTLVVFSVLQRPHWRATVERAGVAAPARIVSVQGVFVGVIVPAGTDTLRLDVDVAVRWMWVSHLVWAFLWLGYAVFGVRRWRDASAA